MTTKSNQPCYDHNALTCTDAHTEPQISAVRGEASLVLQP